ncbi:MULTISPECIES: hypothetical protein [Flavobacterium]|uniref:hypothetical protein n=1 Tax=Flavobacterium TaxID=237 RepID=UPI001182F234|nr:MULTISPECIES: hypothetical protein [Flavobacterium]MCR4030547.1 hypothetical protein [Flavobacterium panacis]
MKKTLLLLVLAVLQTSCSNTNKTNDKWLGETKQKLIKTWGPPVRVLHDDQNNEILLYADQVFTKDHNEDAGIAGPSFWKYDYVYINKEGKIYLLQNEKQKFPPQSVDSKNLVGLSSKTGR